MNEKRLVEAFRASIANHEKCSSGEEKNRGFGYKFKYFVWYLILTFLSPRKKVTSNTFAACMTPVNERRIREFSGLQDIYKFAKLNSSFSAIRENISVLSSYSLAHRIGIFNRGISFYIRYKKELRGYAHFILEYYAIATFLSDHHFEKYITPGMYDRYCTLFSYIGKSNGARLIGVQDGAAVSIDLPAKIYCDEMNCFDEFESNILKKFIKNGDCKYVYTGFKSVLTWSDFNRSGKKALAIASQDWFTSKIIELIDEIMKSDISDFWDIIILPHYRETEETYKKIKEKYPSIIVEHKKRFWNIDLLITFYSTIVYDFWSVNKELEVFCLKIPGYLPGYYDRENVMVFEDKGELIDSVRTLSS